MCDCACSRQGPGLGFSRREFIAGSTLAALSAMLASACGTTIGGLDPSDPTKGLDQLSLRISDYPALATVGGIALIDSTSVPIAVVRTASTTFDAFSRICPHAGTTVGIAGSGFKCPNHGATWNAQGTWVSGQTTTDLIKLQTSYDAATDMLAVKAAKPNVNLVIRLSNFPALVAIGGLARVDTTANLPVGVGHLGSGNFVAYGLTCPHEQTIIDPSGAEWRCQKHGARFAADGSLLAGPAQVGLTGLTAKLDSTGQMLTIVGNVQPGTKWTDD